uniref:BLE2 protein n=1 Tax=Oryza glumipatula TaxID=40148 RepID=A0A0E0AL17_9ORYZ
MADTVTVGGGGEHRVQVAAAKPGGGQQQQGKKAAAPEKWLNGFVRLVALVERVGNALDTLAFTWATVVLLGGYPTCLTALGLVQRFLVCDSHNLSRSRQRRWQQQQVRLPIVLPNQRPLGWNWLIAIVCILDVWKLLIPLPHKKNVMAAVVLYAMVILLILGKSMTPKFQPSLRNPLRRAISLWSPLAAILLMTPAIQHGHSRVFVRNITGNGSISTITGDFAPTRSTVVAKWIVFLLLLISVLVVTISRLQFPRIIKLLDSARGRKLVSWRRSIQNICMFAALVMLVLTTDGFFRFLIIGMLVIVAVMVSSGNLQIPAAVLRVVFAGLALSHLMALHKDNKEDEETNLVPSLIVFYAMVMAQGILYTVACILEIFSFIPRRSLIRRAGFRGQLGVEYVNMYYAYALEKCMEKAVFAPKKTSLGNFAMDSLNSDSPKNHLYGIQLMHSLLEKETTRVRLLEKLITSTKTMARIISMLGWTSPNYMMVRLYAAKVTAELAKDLQVIAVPRAMQLVSALLDTDGKLKKGNPLLQTMNKRRGRIPFSAQKIAKRKDRMQLGMQMIPQKQRQQETLQGTDNLPETQTRSTHIHEQNCIIRSWQKISEYWTVPKEHSLTYHDQLPTLGMLIVDKLASCDQNNCVEIDRVTDLIPKIIGFTSFRSDTTNSEAQQMVLVKSSLKVLQRLTSIEGEIGKALRYKISKHPFLLRNLTDILRDNIRDQELKKLAVGILRNISIDGNTRQEIGNLKVLITRLMKAFLNLRRTSNTNVDFLLPKVAGQALAMLAMDNVHNCLVMLKEPEFITKLKNMILNQDEKYIYVAPSLLRSMCQHAQAKLTELDLKELSHTLREVLERIMNAEGAELEILIGLSSQICKVNPEEFAQELDHGHNRQRFVKKLVDALNANMKPSVHCPGIRKVILEQSIYMMECNSHYANCFNEFRMMDALSIVEETPSRVENYMVFLGDVGFIECGTPLFALVDRAKELMVRQWLQGINSAN